MRCLRIHRYCFPVESSYLLLTSNGGTFLPYRHFGTRQKGTEDGHQRRANMGPVDNARHSKPLGVLLWGLRHSCLCDPLNGHKEKGELKQDLEADERGEPRIVCGWGVLHQDISKQIAIPIDNICQKLWKEGGKESLGVDAHRDGYVRQKVAEKGHSSRSL